MGSLSPPMDFSALLSAFGLSGAAGLNAYIPLVLVAVLGRAGVVTLRAPFDVLGSWWVIAILATFLVVEVVVDKVPGADHVNDVVQTFVRPAAGAVLFATSSGAIGEAHPGVALVCGLVLAFGVHATKAVARPVVNATTLGVGAPVVSTVEDVASAVTSVVAVFLPLLVAFLFVAFVGVAVWVWSRRQRLRRARTARSDAGGDAAARLR